MINDTKLIQSLAELGTEDWFIAVYEDAVICNTPKCSLLHAGGYMTSKVMQHEGNGATTDNLFVVAGPIRVLAVFGVVTAIGGGGVGTDDVMDNLKLELDDGAAQADLTLANSDITNNGTVGTLIIKDAEDSVKMKVMEADQVRYLEGPVSKVFQEEIIVAKTGTTTYIRASYTGDANTDLTITWTIRYAPKTATAVVTAV